MITENFAQQGWQCPICKRVYSPFTPCCFNCGDETKTSTSTDINGTGYVDWLKQQTITTSTYKPQEDNFTSISTGYAQFSAEDIITCDYCKHNAGLPRNNGTTEYSGACKKCVAKDMWEAKEDET